MTALCERLTDATGLPFKVDKDTCEPAASGSALNYWVTEYHDHFDLEVASIYDYVFSERIDTVQDLIDKINEIENDFRYV